MSFTAWMDRTFYPDHHDNWDDDMFRAAVLERVGTRRGLRILDLGAGAGIIPQMNFGGLGHWVAGVDPDPRVLDNPYLDEARVGYAENIPYEDASFDLVVADNVLEHLPDPEAAFREVRRVLRTGGEFLAKTPNRFHYVPLIAAATPHWFHEWVNRRRGRRNEDTFPTLYRANSRRAVAELGRKAGFREVVVTLHEGRPEYLRMTALTYAAGIAYERLVNASAAFEGIRVILIARFVA